MNVGVQTARQAHKDEITHTRPPTQWLWHQKCGGMGVHQGETNDRKDILKHLDSPVEDYLKMTWLAEVCGAVQGLAGGVGGWATWGKTKRVATEGRVGRRTKGVGGGERRSWRTGGGRASIR